MLTVPCCSLCLQTLQEQQAARAQSLAELSRWLGRAEDTLAQQQRAEGDLPALQQRQSDVKVSDILNLGVERERCHPRNAQSLMASCTQELQRSIHSRAASFAGVLKSTEQFLEENKAKLEPGELAALQQDLQRAKEQYQSLQERTEVAQKELESAVSAAVQQETEKVTGQELQSIQAWLGGTVGSLQPSGDAQSSLWFFPGCSPGFPWIFLTRNALGAASREGRVPYCAFGVTLNGWGIVSHTPALLG